MRLLELHTHTPEVVEEHLEDAAGAEHIAVVNYCRQVVVHEVAGQRVQVHEDPERANNGIHLHILKPLLLHGAMLNVLLKW